MSGPSILVERHGEVVVLSLHRPEVLNAIDPAELVDLIDAFGAAGNDERTRAVVLTGSGHAFCAGLDVKAADRWQGSPRSVAERMRFQESFAELVRTIDAARAPFVAAVDGPAAGAGMALALAADIRVASSSARFVPAAINLGLSSGECGISFLLPRIVGAGPAFEILLTGRAVSATEALELKLVTAVHTDRAATLAAAVEIGEVIAGLSPLGVERTKRLLRRNLTAPSLDAALDAENLTQVLSGMSDDSQAAMSRFAQRPSTSASRV
jgi:enoyl-CoA hydratase